MSAAGVKAFRPWAVGAARGIVTAAVLAALAAVVEAANAADLPDGAAIWAPIVIVIVRTLEGLVDDRRQQGAPQAGLLKGGPQ